MKVIDNQSIRLRIKNTNCQIVFEDYETKDSYKMSYDKINNKFDEMVKEIVINIRTFLIYCHSCRSIDSQDLNTPIMIGNY